MNKLEMERVAALPKELQLMVYKMWKKRLRSNLLVVERVRKLPRELQLMVYEAYITGLRERVAKIMWRKVLRLLRFDIRHMTRFLDHLDDNVGVDWAIAGYAMFLEVVVEDYRHQLQYVEANGWERFVGRRWYEVGLFVSDVWTLGDF